MPIAGVIGSNARERQYHPNPSHHQELKMLIRKIMLALAVAFAGLFCRQAQAQEIPQGPFQNTQEVVVTWQNFLPWVGAVVYVDNQLVFGRRGFAPYASGRYYTCQDGFIRLTCPSISNPADGPFPSIKAIVGFWSEADTMGHALLVFADGALVYSRGGFGPAQGVHYVYCNNRPGGGYMTNCNL